MSSQPPSAAGSFRADASLWRKAKSKSKSHASFVGSLTEMPPREDRLLESIFGPTRVVDEWPSDPAGKAKIFNMKTRIDYGLARPLEIGPHLPHGGDVDKLVDVMKHFFERARSSNLHIIRALKRFFWALRILSKASRRRAERSRELVAQFVEWWGDEEERLRREYHEKLMHPNYRLHHTIEESIAEFRKTYTDEDVKDEVVRTLVYRRRVEYLRRRRQWRLEFRAKLEHLANLKEMVRNYVGFGDGKGAAGRHEEHIMAIRQARLAAIQCALKGPTLVISQQNVSIEQLLALAQEVHRKRSKKAKDRVLSEFEKEREEAREKRRQIFEENQARREAEYRAALAEKKALEEAERAREEAELAASGRQASYAASGRRFTTVEISDADPVAERSARLSSIATRRTYDGTRPRDRVGMGMGSGSIAFSASLVALSEAAGGADEGDGQQHGSPDPLDLPSPSRAPSSRQRQRQRSVRLQPSPADPLSGSANMGASIFGASTSCTTLPTAVVADPAQQDGAIATRAALALGADGSRTSSPSKRRGTHAAASPSPAAQQPSPAATPPPAPSPTARDVSPVRDAKRPQQFRLVSTPSLVNQAALQRHEPGAAFRRETEAAAGQDSDRAAVEAAAKARREEQRRREAEEAARAAAAARPPAPELPAFFSKPNRVAAVTEHTESRLHLGNPRRPRPLDYDVAHDGRVVDRSTAESRKHFSVHRFRSGVTDSVETSFGRLYFTSAPSGGGTVVSGAPVGIARRAGTPGPGSVAARGPLGARPLASLTGVNPDASLVPEPASRPGGQSPPPATPAPSVHGSAAVRPESRQLLARLRPSFATPQGKARCEVAVADIVRSRASTPQAGAQQQQQQGSGHSIIAFAEAHGWGAEAQVR